MSAFRTGSYYAWSLLEMGFGFRDWGKLARLFLRARTQAPVTLRLRRQKTSMLVRSRMDTWSVKETFLDRFYTRWGMEIEPRWTIVDIGAAIGEFTVYAAQQVSEGRVLAFEPNPESFALLHENLKLNSIANAQAVHAGVWSQAGKMTLNAANGEPLQAQTEFSGAGREGGEAIPVITLEQLLDEYAPEGIDLLKLDCEGAEYPILFAANPSTLGAVKRIVMEYHDLDERQNHRELASYLQKTGFQVGLHANPVHAEIGYLYAWYAPELA
ncbi:MAG: FkbM family methyltransferase [Anaerolineaceae bacterium]